MKKVVSLNRRGFTLIEVIVVAAIIAILAGILVPMIFSQIDEAKIARATGDVKSISSAIMVFRKDTGKWPTYVGTLAADNTVTFLSGTLGTLPTIAGVGWDQATSNNIEDHLNTDSTGAYDPLWKGSYLSTSGMDPWGHKYVINADAFKTANPVWIISAGPDGIVQTPALATELLVGSDDIGIRIK